MRPNASFGWQIVVTILGLGALGALLGAVVVYPTVRYTLDWYRDTRVRDVNVIGPELSADKSQDIVTIGFTMPADVPRLVDPDGTCSGLLVKNGIELSCLPYLAGNGSLGLCGTCLPGYEIRLGANGTCFDCFPPTDNGLGLCGECSAGDLVRISANGTCFDCFVPNTTSTVILTGSGGVTVAERANDTLVATTAFSWITDPMPATAYVTSYIFSSGSSSVTAWPPGVAGNSMNITLYKLDLAMNVFLTLNPFAAPNPDLGAGLLFTNIASYFPVAVTNPYTDRFHSVGHASCVYYNGVSPLQLSFGGYGAHNNVGTYVFYFPMLDSGSYPVYTGRCELRIEMWLASP